MRFFGIILSSMLPAKLSFDFKMPLNLELIFMFENLIVGLGLFCLYICLGRMLLICNYFNIRITKTI